MFYFSQNSIAIRVTLSHVISVVYLLPMVGLVFGLFLLYINSSKAFLSKMINEE